MSTLSTKMRVFLLLVVLKVIAAQRIRDFENATFNFGGKPSENECKADESSCRCCMMLQKVDTLKQMMNQKLSALEADLTSTQQVYKDLSTHRSAFSAALFLNPTNLLCLGPFSNTRTIKYQNVFFNLGNNYNVSTGFYTAPYAGSYSLSVSVFHDAGQESNEQSCVFLMVNNAMIAGASDIHRYDHEDSTTVSIAAHLNAGDKVEVRLKSGCLLCMENSHYNVFSGFLLYAD